MSKIFSFRKQFEKKHLTEINKKYKKVYQFKKIIEEIFDINKDKISQEELIELLKLELEEKRILTEIAIKKYNLLKRLGIEDIEEYSIQYI